MGHKSKFKSQKFRLESRKSIPNSNGVPMGPSQKSKAKNQKSKDKNQRAPWAPLGHAVRRAPFVLFLTRRQCFSVPWRQCFCAAETLSLCRRRQIHVEICDCNMGKHRKNITNCLKQDQVARFGPILWHNRAHRLWKPLACLPAPKTAKKQNKSKKASGP